ncbi:hypothetical protein GFPCMMHI_05643 [Ensifer adhaerens]|nr:hypothetical protein [Ensifer adhaerens]
MLKRLYTPDVLDPPHGTIQTDYRNRWKVAVAFVSFQ